MPTEIIRRDYNWNTNTRSDRVLKRFEEGVTPGWVKILGVGWIYVEARGVDERTRDKVIRSGHRLSAIVEKKPKTPKVNGKLFVTGPGMGVQPVGKSLLARWVED